MKNYIWFKVFKFINKVDGYIRKYDKARYLALFHSEKFNKLFNRVS